MESTVLPPFVAGPLRLDPFAAMMMDARRVNDPASARLFARPYRAVTGRITQWRERGMLTRDDGPAIYLHEYTSTGMTVRGLVGLLDVSRRAAKPEDRVVLPHEGIHPRQADELADRMEQMQINPAPILLVHHGPDSVRQIVASTAAGQPDWVYDDKARQRHRIWAIRDPATIASLQQGWRESTALIADGHHRYAGYLRMQARHPGTAADWGLAMLVDQSDTPLYLGAIHRVLTSVRIEDVRQAAQRLNLQVRDVSTIEALDQLSTGAIAVTDGRTWISVRTETAPDSTVVESVHSNLIPALPRGPHSISYHHSVEEALGQLRKHKGTAVILPAPTVDEVLTAAATDRLLPEKATSFQPKPPPGVLIRSMKDA